MKGNTSAENANIITTAKVKLIRHQKANIKKLNILAGNVNIWKLQMLNLVDIKEYFIK